MCSHLLECSLGYLSLPITTSVSCHWVFLFFSSFTLFCSSMGFLPSLLESIGYLFVSLFLRLSLSGFPLTLSLPQQSFSPHTRVFLLLYMHHICQVSFYSGFGLYGIFSTYLLVSCCALFLPAEALSSLCRVFVCFCRTSWVPKLEALFT